MNNTYTELDDIANEFAVDIIYDIMDKFKINYEKVSEILFEKLGYSKIFNDTEIMVVGAHHGTEDIIKKVKKILDQEKLGE